MKINNTIIPTPTPTPTTAGSLPLGTCYRGADTPLEIALKQGRFYMTAHCDEVRVPDGSRVVVRMTTGEYYVEGNDRPVIVGELELVLSKEAKDGRL